MEKWFHKWRFKINENKSSHIIFTLRKQSCPQVSINNIPIPNKDSVRYLDMILDRRMTWKRRIVDKSKQLKLKFKKFYWLFGRFSNLSVQNKIMLYKVTLKHVWSYGIQLWGTASNFNIEILQRFQSKTLRSLIDASWYATNIATFRYLQLKKKYQNSVKPPKPTSYSITWHDGSDPQAKRILPSRFKYQVQLESNIR